MITSHTPLSAIETEADARALAKACWRALDQLTADAPLRMKVALTKKARDAEALAEAMAD